MGPVGAFPAGSFVGVTHLPVRMPRHVVRGLLSAGEQFDFAFDSFSRGGGQLGSREAPRGVSRVPGADFSSYLCCQLTRSPCSTGAGHLHPGTSPLSGVWGVLGPPRHLPGCSLAVSCRRAGPIAAPLGHLPWREPGWPCPGAVLCLWPWFCWTWGSLCTLAVPGACPLLMPPCWTQSGLCTLAGQVCTLRPFPFKMHPKHVE